VTTATLVTGAAGFIGSHLVEALLERGDSVVAVDNFDNAYASEAKWANLAGVMHHPRLHLLVGDIRDQSTVEQALRTGPVRRVVHLAARAGVRPSLRDPALYADVNVRGTAVLFEACGRAQVDHVVLASSSSVYGARNTAPFREDEPVDQPESPYALTKRANELQSWTFHRHTQVPVTCLRFFTAYGPRNRPDMAVYKFADAILRRREILLYGTGTARDFTYIGDIVAGVVAALDRPQGLLVCNLGGGHPVEVTALVAGLEGLLGKAARVQQRELPPGDVPLTCADPGLAEARLGWRATTPLDQGLERFTSWFLAERRTPGSPRRTVSVPGVPTEGVRPT
jgi:UDP-glucuronate 4-epimerase